MLSAATVTLVEVETAAKLAKREELANESDVLDSMIAPTHLTER